jgi:NTP pyrophosphatase (non-canonical NTP hydrolase)
MDTWRKSVTDDERVRLARDILQIRARHDPLPSRDSLEAIFFLQSELREFFLKYTKLGDMTQHERTGYYCLSLITEACELLENVRGWKPHQSNPPPVDKINLREEIADMLHFIVNICEEWGLDAEDVYGEYFKKNNENRRRQHNGY